MPVAVTVRADENISGYTEFTLPIIKKYAEKIGADFILLNQPPPFMTKEEGREYPHYRILECKSLLDNYERIINLDADILILPSCPNLLEVVPPNCVGSIFEDKGTRQVDRQSRIIGIQREFDYICWESGYINTGVFVFSRMHKLMFSPVNGKYWTSWGSDDLHFGYQINRLCFPHYELPYQFNHMTMFSEEWNGFANRFNSYIIHYAGNGVFDKDRPSRIDQIKRDYERILRNI